MSDHGTDLIRLNAANWLREDYPLIYALIEANMMAGRTKQEILNECAKMPEVNSDVMGTIGMTIDYLSNRKALFEPGFPGNQT